MRESEIYSRVADGEHGERWLNDLFVRPKGDENFVPKDNNWRSSAKVPILILNATRFNTGHNRQFTASWMGEPPARCRCTNRRQLPASSRLARRFAEGPAEYSSRPRRRG